MTQSFSARKAHAFSLAVAVALSVSGFIALAGGTSSATSAAQQQCPTPTGGTQTATATACPSTPASTASPGTPTSPRTTTPAGTTTVTATVTGSPATRGPGSRTVTLETSKPIKTYGQEFTLSGGISSESPQCVVAEVEILRTVEGSQTQERFATVSSNQDGTFSESFTADVSGNYIARVDASGGCEAGTSEVERVTVRVAVNLALSKQTVQRGNRIRLRAGVAPCGDHADTRIVLFRLIGGEFSKVDSARLGDDCRARFTKRVRKTTAFQARWPKQDADHAAGRSRKKGVRVTR